MPDAMLLRSPIAVSHISDARKNRDRFARKTVAVAGAGQSATKFAALLNEGADLEMLIRQPRLRWLVPSRFKFLPGVRATNSKRNKIRAPPSRSSTRRSVYAGAVIRLVLGAVALVMVCVCAPGQMISGDNSLPSVYS